MKYNIMPSYKIKPQESVTLSVHHSACIFLFSSTKHKRLEKLWVLCKDKLPTIDARKSAKHFPLINAALYVFLGFITMLLASYLITQTVQAAHLALIVVTTLLWKVIECLHLISVILFSEFLHIVISGKFNCHPGQLPPRALAT